MFQSSRLLFRKVKMKDLEAIHNYALDPDVLRYTLASTPKDISETESYIHSMLVSKECDHHFAMTIPPSDVCMGVIEFFYEASGGSIHYAISKAHWGKGYMTEAVQAVLQWVRRKYPDLMVIETFVFEANIASQRVLEKNGFSKIGTKMITKEGRDIREYIYRLDLNPAS